MASRTIGRLLPKSGLEAPNEKFLISQAATAATWYDVGNGTVTPRSVRMLIDGASRGKVGPLYAFYDRMEATDTRFGGIVSQIESTVSGLPYKVVPPVTLTQTERNIADDYVGVVQEAYEHLDIHQLIKSFVAPYISGAKLYRMLWEQEEFGYNKKLWFPKKVQKVEPNNMLMDKNPESETYGQMLIMTREHPEGIPLSDLHYSSYIFLEDGDAENRYDRVGVARKVVPWFVGVQFVQGWWLQYIEGYGAPMRIGRYPQGASSTAKIDMERYLRVLGQHGYALFPQDMEVQLLEANRQGTITTYGDFIKKAHDEYAIAMLGQSDTIGDKRNGSFARTQVTNDIRIDIVANVAKIVENGFRQLNDKIIRVNYGNEYVRRLVPKFDVVIVKSADSQVKANTAILAQNNGIPIPVDYWYEQILGAPKPREGEPSILNGSEFNFGEEAPEKREVPQKENVEPTEDKEDASIV